MLPRRLYPLNTERCLSTSVWQATQDLTPGNAYEDAWNGNKSDIHWDMILRMDAELGGGEIHFDDKLIRKDGRFVVPELEGLNPENLL